MYNNYFELFYSLAYSRLQGSVRDNILKLLPCTQILWSIGSTSGQHLSALNEMLITLIATCKLNICTGKFDLLF